MCSVLLRLLLTIAQGVSANVLTEKINERIAIFLQVSGNYHLGPLHCNGPAVV